MKAGFMYIEKYRKKKLTTGPKIIIVNFGSYCPRNSL